MVSFFVHNNCFFVVFCTILVLEFLVIGSSNVSNNYKEFVKKLYVHLIFDIWQILYKCISFLEFDTHYLFLCVLFEFTDKTDCPFMVFSIIKGYIYTLMIVLFSCFEMYFSFSIELSRTCCKITSLPFQRKLLLIPVNFYVAWLAIQCLHSNYIIFLKFLIHVYGFSKENNI